MADWVQCSNLGGVGVNDSLFCTDFLVLVAEQPCRYAFGICRIKFLIHQAGYFNKSKEQVLFSISLSNFSVKCRSLSAYHLLCKFMQTVYAKYLEVLFWKQKNEEEGAVSSREILPMISLICSLSKGVSSMLLTRRTRPECMLMSCRVCVLHSSRYNLCSKGIEILLLFVSCNKKLV